MNVFEYIKKKLRFLQLKKENDAENTGQNPYKFKEKYINKASLSPDLAYNLDNLKVILQSPDVIFREINIGYKWQTKAALIFLDGMTDTAIINDNIVKPLLYDIQLINPKEHFDPRDIKTLKNNLISVGEVKEAQKISDLVESCLSGDTLLLVDGSASSLIITAKEWEKRSIEEPKSSAIVRGPHEGFTESIKTNIVLIRRKIRDPNLIIEKIKLGKISRTDIALVYIRGIINPAIIREIKERLNRIKIDAILESGYIEQFIEDAPFSLFATVGNSERPDQVVAKILEGRAAIIIDGTPFVLTVPFLFIEGFQSPEDYYSRPYYASIVRSIRYVSFFLSTLSPAIYVALTSFHQNSIPTPLLITIAQSREGLPFPSMVETLLMGIIFEILREAGIRLPRAVGSAISIVGALVIGESAVSAGIIGAPMVIIVALTAIASFVVTALVDASAILRVFFLFLAGTLGAFGIIIGILSVLIHLCSLRSFGAPYLAPLSPLFIVGLKDSFLRVPLWAMLVRPPSILWRKSWRMKGGLIPRAPQETGKTPRNKKKSISLGRQSP